MHLVLSCFTMKKTSIIFMYMFHIVHYSIHCTIFPSWDPFVIYQPVPDNLKFDDHIIGRGFVCFIEFVLATIARLYLYACQEAQKGRVVLIGIYSAEKVQACLLMHHIQYPGYLLCCSLAYVLLFRLE